MTDFSDSNVNFFYTLEDALLEQNVIKGNQILLPDDLAETIPNLYEQDGMENDSVAYVRYFSYSGGLEGWNWYVTEYNGSGTFFGYVEGIEPEYGYFNLREFEFLNRAYFPLPIIIRDVCFKPTKLSSLI